MLDFAEISFLFIFVKSDILFFNFLLRTYTAVESKLGQPVLSDLQLVVAKHFI